MYTNCRSGSLLPWKIIADQDAEEYLLQSLLKKLKGNGSRNHEHNTNWDKSSRPEANDSTRKTRYEEGNPKKEPDKAETKTETPAELEEMGQELWNKINRIAIVDMMEGGHITIEEGEIELKHLDSSEMENTFTKKTEDKGPDKDTNHNLEE